MSGDDEVCSKVDLPDLGFYIRVTERPCNLDSGSLALMPNGRCRILHVLVIPNRNPEHFEAAARGLRTTLNCRGESNFRPPP